MNRSKQVLDESLTPQGIEVGEMSLPKASWRAGHRLSPDESEGSRPV